MNRIFFSILFATAWLNSHAQSSMPACPNDPSVVWNNCVGTYIGDDGRKYRGSFKNDLRRGQGALISAKGYTLVEGVWLNDATVETGGGQWRIVSSTNDVVWFVLTKSIGLEGVSRRAWLMRAYAEPYPEYGWLSGRELQKFDCANERFQQVKATLFSGSWGSGDVLYSFGEQEWEYVPPGTAFESVARYICDFKLPSSQ
jgi:hypothetical protein